MNIQDIVVEIDAEISRLQQVKALLTGSSATEKRKAGRPANTSLAGKARTRRTLSAEARERIATAQRARWAKSKKAAKKAAPNIPAASTAKNAPAVGLGTKSKKKRTLSAGVRAKIASRPKSPVGEGAEGHEENRFGKGCKEVCSSEEDCFRKEGGCIEDEGCCRSENSSQASNRSFVKLPPMRCTSCDDDHCH